MGIKNIILSFVYANQMIYVIWTTKKSFLFSLFFLIIVTSMSPFVYVILTRESIDMLTTQAYFYTFVVVILFLIGAIFILRIIESILNYKTQVYRNTVGIFLYRKLFYKSLNLNYEMYMDKSIMEKRNLAMSAIEGGRFSDLITSFQQSLSNVIIIIGIISILAQINILLLIVSLATVVVNSILAIREKKVLRENIWTIIR